MSLLEPNTDKGILTLELPPCQNRSPGHSEDAFVQPSQPKIFPSICTRVLLMLSLVSEVQDLQTLVSTWFGLCCLPDNLVRGLGGRLHSATG